MCLYILYCFSDMQIVTSIRKTHTKEQQTCILNKQK